MEQHVHTLRVHLLKDFLSLSFVERSVEKTRHEHNQNLDDFSSDCFGQEDISEEEIIQIAIEDSWMQSIHEAGEKELTRLAIRADMYSAYEQDVNRATGILDKILSWWEATPPDEIPQQHQVVRILMDGRRKSIETVGEQDPDNTLRVEEEDGLRADSREDVDLLSDE